MTRFKKQENDRVLSVESKYLKKFEEILGWSEIERVGKEYASAPLAFQPVRMKLTRDEQESLILDVIMSQKLTIKEKLDTLIGLTMVWDGLMPDKAKWLNLELVFGREFIETLSFIGKDHEI